MRLIRIISLSLLALLSCYTTYATDLPEPPPRVLAVGVNLNSMPVSGMINDKFTGLSVELWRSIADQLGYQYRFYPISDSHLGQELIRLKLLDVMLGPYELNPIGFHLFDYSTPILINSLNLLVKNNPVSFRSILQEIMTPLLKNTLISTFLLFGFFTFLLWIFERNKHEEMKNISFFQGIGNSLWAIVSSFVRDLVYTPATTAGRWIMSLWLICSVVFMSIIISSVTATIINLKTTYHSEYKNHMDIQGEHVGVLENRAGHDFALHHGASVLTTESIATLLDWLNQGNIEAVVGDKAILQYYLKQYPDFPFHFSGADLETEMYAIILQLNSPYTRAIDRTLLTMQMDKTNEHTCRQFFSGDIENCTL